MARLAITAYRAKELRKKLDAAMKKRDEIQASVQEKEQVVVEATETEEELTEEEVNAIEAETEELEKALAEKASEIEELNAKIGELESEIEEANKKNEEDQEAEVERAADVKEKIEVRGEVKRMETAAMIKRGFFEGYKRNEVESIVEREESKEFLERVRKMAVEKRDVTGSELAIPKVFLGLLRDNLHKYSKLMKYVTVRAVRGTARALIAGPIPEAVWTEMCAKLNELNISFNEVEVDGYKVGGFVAVCNATLADSDIDLANEIMYNIAQAIGFALDKAILYGKGVKMPVGIVTRLAEAAQPAYWGANEPTWTNLSTTNLKAIGTAEAPASGLDLYKGIIGASIAAKPLYSTGDKFFAMSESTFQKLQLEGITLNVNGAIVSAMGGAKQMPFVGGNIEILPFIPDGDVIGGYGANYLLVEREGAAFESSRHYQFVEQNTVFLGYARYDGRPVVGEAFVAFNINGAAPTTTMTFAADSANI